MNSNQPPQTKTEYPENLATKLTSKKQLKKSMLINLLTKVLPIIIGIVTTPYLISGLGDERFGIIQIYWTIVGFSTVFDFGLGRALTQLVSKMIAQHEHETLGPTVWTIITIMIGLSSVGMIGLLLATKPIVAAINVSPQYFDEACRGYQWLVMSLPLLIVFIGLTGILESFQRFWDTNLQRYPILFFNFVAPVLLLKWFPHLDWMMMMVVVGRIIATIMALVSVSKCFPQFWRSIAWDGSHLQSLLKFGSWTTISNIVRPFMLYQDRLFLANWLTPANIIFYTTPYGVLSRQVVFAESVLNVLFPAFGTSFVKDPQRAKGMYLKAILYLSIGFGLIALFFTFTSKWLLTLWLSESFAEKSWLITVVCAYVHALASVNLVPLSLIQASGRSDITAKVLLIQFPFYIVLLWWGVKEYGLIAAPAVLFLRLVADTWMMHWQAMRLLKTAIANHVPDPPPLSTTAV
jgi:O-antigen/teichoic acid export membrane protein